MAGGLTGISQFTAGTALDVTGEAASAGGMLAGFAGLSNPLSAGLSVLSALGGLGGAPSLSQSAAQGMSSSGLGVFAPENLVKAKNPMIDFSSPMQVATLALIVIFAIYGIKRLKNG